MSESKHLIKTLKEIIKKRTLESKTNERRKS